LKKGNEKKMKKKAWENQKSLAAPYVGTFHNFSYNSFAGFEQLSRVP